MADKTLMKVRVNVTEVASCKIKTNHMKDACREEKNCGADRSALHLSYYTESPNLWLTNNIDQ